MDLTKYESDSQKKRKISYSVPLPPEVEAELKAIRESTKFPVREWARDLILENLPKLRSHVGKKSA